MVLGGTDILKLLIGWGILPPPTTICILYYRQRDSYRWRIRFTVITKNSGLPFSHASQVTLAAWHGRDARFRWDGDSGRRFPGLGQGLTLGPELIVTGIGLASRSLHAIQSGNHTRPLFTRDQGPKLLRQASTRPLLVR